MKVGDKVRIRKDLVAGNVYGGMNFVPGMLVGEQVIRYFHGNKFYIEGSGYMYTPEMLEPEEEYVRGEMVEVCKRGIWYSRIYLARLDEVANPYVCVHHGYEEEFREGGRIEVKCWEEIRKIPKEEMTKEQAEEKYGIKIVG